MLRVVSFNSAKPARHTFGWGRLWLDMFGACRTRFHNIMLVIFSSNSPRLWPVRFFFSFQGNSASSIRRSQRRVRSLCSSTAFRVLSKQNSHTFRLIVESDNEKRNFHKVFYVRRAFARGFYNKFNHRDYQSCVSTFARSRFINYVS